MVAAAGLVVLSTHTADKLGHRVAEAGAQAVRGQAERALRGATAYQTQTYEMQLREAAAFTRGIADFAEDVLRDRSRYPMPKHSMKLESARGYFTNDRTAPASVIAWGHDVLQPAQRERMRRFAHLDPLLRHARRANSMIAAAWTISELRTSRYVPNTPLVKQIPPNARNTPLDSPFYRIATPSANPGGGTVWSEVYQDPAGKGLTITVATPFHAPVPGPEAPEFAGAAGIDLVLDDMLDALKRTRVELGPKMAMASGFGFLMRGDGRLIAFPADKRARFGLPSAPQRAPGEVLEHDLQDAKAAALRRLGESLGDIEMPAIRRLTIDGRDYLVGLDRIATTGWVFANVVPARAVFAPVRETRKRIDADIAEMGWKLTAIAVGGLFAVLIVVLFVVDRLVVGPLNRVAAGARRVGAGDVGVRIDDGRRDELGEVTRAFDHMAETVGASMQSLEDRVEARTAELREARDQAAAADAAKMRFLSRMNHELRSPLNAILGYADLIRSQSMGERPDLYVQYAQTIRDSGQHMLDMVEDVLAMAKLEHATYTIAPDWLDVSEVAERCARMVQPEADSQGVRLSTHLTRSPTALHADERALRQMLLNLLSNALKFAGEGGAVDLTAERRPDGGLAISVRDTGPGIAPADQDRILRPFEQVDDQASRKGTGLGLAITYRLIGLHDGDLVMDSAPGAGSTLTLVFPPGCVSTAAGSG